MAQLVINLTDEGEATVTGPIDNALVAYGMLEIARDLIKAHNDQKTRAIQPASPSDVVSLNRKIQ